MRIQPWLGDICDACCDVICVSTNPYLELMAGTGGAVRARGGWSIQAECKGLIDRHYQLTGNQYLSAGSVALVNAGALPFRKVVLCVAIDPFHDSSEEIIGQCVSNALHQISRLEPPVKSIAFPVLAAGHAQFDFERSLRAMLRTVTHHAPATLEIIYIITLDELQLSLMQTILNENKNE